MNDEWKNAFHDINAREELKKEVLKASMSEPLKETEKSFLKRIAVIVEGVAFLILAILIIIRGFHQGIWQDSKFYEKEIKNETRIYTEKSRPTIAINPGKVQGEKEIYPIEVQIENEQEINLYATLDINGSQVTVRVFGEDETMVLSGIYHKKGDKYTEVSEPSGILSAYMDERTENNVIISEEALCNMILGNETIRILGDSHLLFISILCFGICFFVNLWGIPVALWLSGFYLQFCYQVKGELKESELLPVVVYGYGLLHFIMGAYIVVTFLFA